MDWQPKAWGRTRPTHSGPLYSRHELELKAGGYCSLHYHRQRANRFHLVSGVIILARCYAWAVVRSGLTAGNMFDIPSEVVHQFQVLEDGVMIEEYWPDRGGAVDDGDIVRLTTGGLAAAATLRRCAGVMLEPNLFTTADIRVSAKLETR